MKKLILPAVLIAFAAITLTINGCYYDVEDQLYPPCDTTQVNITYSQDVTRILTNNCYGCHSNAAAPNSGNNISLEGHSNVLVQVTNGKLMGSLWHLANVSAMPKNATNTPLSQCDISTIHQWIAKGSPND